MSHELEKIGAGKAVSTLETEGGNMERVRGGLMRLAEILGNNPNAIDLLDPAKRAEIVQHTQGGLSVFGSLPGKVGELVRKGEAMLQDAQERPMEAGIQVAKTAVTVGAVVKVLQMINSKDPKTKAAGHALAVAGGIGALLWMGGKALVKGGMWAGGKLAGAAQEGVRKMGEKMSQKADGAEGAAAAA